jgi:hypothetical protein
MRTWTSLAALLLVCQADASIAAAGRSAATQTPRARTAVSPRLTNARTVFLINEIPQSSGAVEFGELQSELRRWNRLALVNDPGRADLTVSLTSETIERQASRTGPLFGAKLANPKIDRIQSTRYTVTVRDRATREIVWSGANETVAAAVQPLRVILTTGPRVCVLFWCR